MFATLRRRTPSRVRPARDLGRGLRVEPLGDRVLPSTAIGWLPPPEAELGTTGAFTPPIGSNKGSILTPGGTTPSQRGQLLAEEPIHF